MASIYNSTATSSSTSASTIRGYGGLASGLDTDTLIENFTYATRAKIAKQKQNLQSLQWEQESVQSISSKLVELSQSYTSYTSSTNLSSTKFWSRSNVTTEGTYSKYVSASGTSSSVDSVSIAGVKQLAKAATMTSNGTVSDKELSTGEISIIKDGKEDTTSVSRLEGNSLKIKYGSTSYTVSLGSGTTSDGFTYDYTTGTKAVQSFTKALQNVSLGDGKTLADVITVSSDGTDENYSLDMKSSNTAGNTVKITGGSQEALEALGIVKSGGAIADASDSDTIIDSDGFSATVKARQEENGLFSEESFAERVGGKNIKFTYNGTSSTLTFMTQSELETAFNKLSDKTNENALKVVADDLQDQLDTAFGTGRITVSVKDSELVFKTTIPSDKEEKDEDTSSVLTITSGSTGVIGTTGALNVEYGESNRLNLSATLENSGISGIYEAINGEDSKYLNVDTTYYDGAYLVQTAIESLGDKATGVSFDTLKSLIKSNNSSLTDTQISQINQAIDRFAEYDESGVKGAVTSVADLKSRIDTYVENASLDLSINGVDIKGLSYDSTLSEIISAINSSDAKVTASYLSTSDKFTITSTAGGEAGKINFLNEDGELSTAAAMIFGTEGTGETNYTVTDGQDAIIAVKYEGSDTATELRRSDNSFDLDGMTVKVTGTFGYEYTSDSTNGNYILNDSGSYEKVSDTSTYYTADGSDVYVKATDGTLVKASSAYYTYESETNTYTQSSSGTYVKTDDGEYKSVESKTTYFDSSGESVSQTYLKTDSGNLVKSTNGLYSYTAKNNTDTVSFNATVDADKITDAVSSMIEALNEIIEEVNTQVSTKPDRDYSPLTDEQEEEMTDDQIESWNEAAKAGCLFADSDLRSLSDSLRSLLSQDYDSKSMLESYGISLSDEYSDNGKLVFDEDTFRAALESNPDDLKELFTESADDSTGDPGGLMARISEITTKYASTTGATKGILIERAGSSYAPTSVLDNSIQNEMDDIEDYIDQLEDKLETEQDRYIDKFTNLETLISQMNSQSSWLSSSLSS